MANEFVIVRSDLHESPEVLRISVACKIPPLHVVGCLHRVWGWARRQADDTGTVYTPAATIDGLAQVPGFADAMQECRWLSAGADRMTFPNSDRWINRDALKRARSRERAVESRARKRTESAPKAHAMRTESAPDKSREEKSREEQENGCAVLAPSPDFVPELRVLAGKRIARLAGIPASQVPATLIGEVVAYTAGQPSRKHEAASWPDDAPEPMDRARMIGAAFDVADAEAQAKTPHGVVGFVVGVMESAIVAGEYPEPRGEVRSPFAEPKRKKVTGW